VTSALVNLILSSEEIIRVFSQTENALDRAKIFEQNDSLASLIQYLIHLLNVNGDNSYAEEMEELFKDSLGYYILKDASKAKFIDLCRTLYIDLQSRTSRGVLKYADKTGFSIPSVLAIMTAKKDSPEIANAESWIPENLFNAANNHLTEKIGVIGLLREVRLGTDSRASQFNPEVVAKILIGWVNGDNLSNLSTLHPYYNDKPADERMNEFVSYLSGATFKSSWGLSALEGIVNAKDEDLAEGSHIPSMIYYGVKSKEAIAVRMLGAPRGISNKLAEVLFVNQEPTSFNEVRKKINDLSLSDWENIIPQNSGLSSNEWKSITDILLK